MSWMLRAMGGLGLKDPGPCHLYCLDTLLACELFPKMF